MDGNGRWATRRGRPRPAGHRAGAEALRRVVEAAPGLGVGTLTAYAFSSDNWSRPRPEVEALMGLLGGYLRSETARLKRAGVRLQLIGRRDRLPGALRNAAARAEWETRGGTRLLLRLAVDYSSQWALAQAAARLAGGAPAGPVASGGASARVASAPAGGDGASGLVPSAATPPPSAAASGPSTPTASGAATAGRAPATSGASDTSGAGDAGEAPAASGPGAFQAALAAVLHPDGAPAGPVDLFVRTGGERRLSDFLLWESAYAELLFLDVPWPDVTGDTLAGAVADFHGRRRRFGGLAEAVPAA